MSKKSIVIGALLLVVLLATLWFGMKLGERNAEKVAGGAQIVSGGSAVLPLPAAPAPANTFNQTPPWVASSPLVNGPLPGMQNSAAQIERQKQLAELKTMQMALMKSMQETHRADPKEVDALLVKIKQVTGSSTVGGVDIEALRGNLARATEMQRIAEDMQRETQKPGGADAKKIKAYAEQLQKLQQQNIAAPVMQIKPAGGPAK